MANKLLIIQGFHPETRQLMIHTEIYGGHEAAQMLKEYTKQYPTYTFTLRMA